MVPLKANPRLLSIGYIIRNHLGDVVKANFAIIPNGSNNVSKALALLYGIKLAISINIKSLIIEGDSMNIILALRNSNASNWKVDYIIQEVLRLLPHFDYSLGIHCYREANSVADHLANQGCLLSEGKKFYLPPICIRIKSFGQELEAISKLLKGAILFFTNIGCSLCSPFLFHVSS
ncbi:hypothetical protein SUGI_0963290 [Cryptomeria japonica]|nr:hypothetical protein SUGI_0963290 [Cryptomeria japonica]